MLIILTYVILDVVATPYINTQARTTKHFDIFGVSISESMLAAAQAKLEHYGNTCFSSNIRETIKALLCRGQ